MSRNGYRVVPACFIFFFRFFFYFYFFFPAFKIYKAGNSLLGLFIYVDTHLKNIEFRKCSNFDKVQRLMNGLSILITCLPLFYYRQLSNNKITRIESEAFNKVDASDINLRNNSIRQLQSNAFKLVSLVGNLDMQDSQLTELPTNTLNVLTATNVFLSSSGIRTIHPEALYSVDVSEDM